MKNKTRYVLLGLLQEEDLSGYEIKKNINQYLSSFWNESYGQIYPTLNQLLKEGLVTVEDIEHHTRKNGEISTKKDKRVYSITPAGRENLLWWIMQENEKDTVRNEFLLKFYMSTPMHSEDMVRHIATYKQQCQRQLDLFIQTKEHLEKVPNLHNNHKHILMILELGIETREFEIRWCEETKEKLLAEIEEKASQPNDTTKEQDTIGIAT